MKKHPRRSAIGALAIGAVAGVAAVVPASTAAAAAAGWQPVTYGLTVTPASLLPATVSSQQPARVVSTSLDADGRPVVTVKTATDKATAIAYVKAGQTAPNAIGVQLDSVVHATEIPTGTDPSRAQQWAFTKIRVPDAWQKSTGAGVTVAVIDSGVDTYHPEFAGQVLLGIDYVTDTSGFITDPNGHGTHVAGIIAAVTGNDAGVSSIAPDSKILPVRVLDATGTGYASSVAAGIVFAADHLAGVINMSLGGSSRDSAVSNAVSYARSKGIVVVAAAGNDRAKGSPVSYPAADAGVIGVAATDSANKVASYSTAGSYVDVAAPGSSILSTVPKDGYAVMSGTSMASPHVAAVAALVKAENPALTPDQVETMLEKSAVDLGAAGKDNDYGYGRIDALAAVTAAVPITTPPTTVPITTPPTTVPVTTPPITVPITTPPTTVPVTTPPTTVPITTPPTTVPVTTPPATIPITTAPTTAPPTTTPTPTPRPTATPAPTKAAPKVQPVIRVVSSVNFLEYGSPATVAYTVTASGKAWALQPMRIMVNPAGGTVAYSDAITDAAGRVLFSQPVTGGMQVRLIAVGTERSTEVSSTMVAFTVHAKIAVTSPAKGTLKVVLAGAAGQTVQVHRIEKGQWVPATSYVARSSDFTMTGLVSGTQYRVIVPTTVAFAGASGSVRIS